MKEKELLFSVTEKDFVFTPYRGSGAGGQKKNKTSSAMRCFHPPSGAEGKCEEYREQSRNKKEAFQRMYNTKAFKSWLEIETARVNGTLLEIEKKVEKEIKRVKIEVKDENGRWKKVDELLEGKNE